MDNFSVSPKDLRESHSRKVDFEQPGAKGMVVDLPKSPQLMKRTIQEYKVPRWI